MEEMRQKRMRGRAAKEGRQEADREELDSLRRKLVEGERNEVERDSGLREGGRAAIGMKVLLALVILAVASPRTTEQGTRSPRIQGSLTLPPGALETQTVQEGRSGRGGESQPPLYFGVAGGRNRSCGSEWLF